MRNKSLFLLLIVVSVLFGCAREGFEVNHAKLNRTIEASVDGNGVVTPERESINIAYSINPYRKSFTFKLTSPDGDLSWEGDLKAGRSKSEDLMITPGATFESGDYAILIYSEEGDVYSSSLALSEADYIGFPYFDVNNTLIGDCSSITIYKDGEFIETIDQRSGYILDIDSDKAEFSFKDRYGNDIKLIQKLN